MLDIPEPEPAGLKSKKGRRIRELGWVVDVFCRRRIKPGWYEIALESSRVALYKEREAGMHRRVQRVFAWRRAKKMGVS